MKLVLDAVRGLRGPLVLDGDMNVTAESDAMHVFNGVLEDLSGLYGVETTLSDIGKVKGVACDHILVSPDIRVDKFDVKNELVSDHKALTLEFGI